MILFGSYNYYCRGKGLNETLYPLERVLLETTLGTPLPTPFRVSSRIFSLGGSSKEILVPGPSFCVQGRNAHSYAKKEGLGMRLLPSLEFPHMVNFAFIHIYTQSH